MNAICMHSQFKHVSPRHMEVCTDAECTRMRPANLTKPKVACAVCGKCVCIYLFIGGWINGSMDKWMYGTYE